MSLQISMVLFQEKPELCTKELQKVLSAKWPDLPLATEVAEQDEMLSLRIGAIDVIIATMPVPFPWSDLEGPCATSILWPDAATAIRGHKNHGIITVTGEGSPVELSKLLTQVTAALMESSSKALGVYWANAKMIVPKNLFSDFAIEVLPGGLPLPIWIDYRVGWTENKNISGGFTTGLATLGLMDLETESATEPPSELRKRFEAIAGYLLENGLVIKDGDTVGESATEKIRVVYAPSAFGAKESVMRLMYEPSAEKKSWWKRW